MATGKFKCTKCDRTFSMAAHLARHMNAMHGAKGRRAAAKRKTLRAKARTGRTRGYAKRARAKKAARSPLARRGAMPRTLGAGVAQLISGMQRCCDDLLAQRAKLDVEISALSGAMDAMRGVTAAAPTRARRGRPARAARPVRRGRPVGTGGRAGSLKTYIVKVLRQRATPMSPKAIAGKIVLAGYKSKAKDLTKAVSNALPQLKGVKKIGFGKYKIA